MKTFESFVLRRMLLCHPRPRSSIQSPSQTLIECWEKFPVITQSYTPGYCVFVDAGLPLFCHFSSDGFSLTGPLDRQYGQYITPDHRPMSASFNSGSHQYRSKKLILPDNSEELFFGPYQPCSPAFPKLPRVRDRSSVFVGVRR